MVLRKQKKYCKLREEVLERILCEISFGTFRNDISDGKTRQKT